MSRSQDVRADLARLGGFFVLTDATGTDAVPFDELLGDAPLAARLDQVRRALAQGTGQDPADVDGKVAMSALQVGLASRLWSVGLAAAVLHGAVPDLRSRHLLGSPGHRGDVPLALAEGTPWCTVSGPRETAAELARTVVDGSLADLDAACSRVGRVPPRVLLSNAASSLVGAARVLATARPGAAATAWAVVRLVLTAPGLAPGGATRSRAGLPPGTGGPMERADEAFLRAGCCLFDRIPGHGLCPDCVRAPTHAHLVTPGH
ncbi:(2Fe-2S)-binding protein [uncultured Serinicoccus sp.]|uniref:(2Fe-2S)-binding protein n=1 Tax=uncultured Serinicoccus sp. TaxID=735514 RepID=UPI002632945A|nr:(2Fe-2S)-binding protein [uncultured Serinicoccus sp.]